MSVFEKMNMKWVIRLNSDSNNGMAETINTIMSYAPISSAHVHEHTTELQDNFHERRKLTLTMHVLCVLYKHKDWEVLEQRDFLIFIFSVPSILQGTYQVNV